MTENFTPPPPTKSQYKSSSSLEGFHFHEFSFLLALIIPFAFLVFGMIEALGWIWRPLAGILYLLLFGRCMLTLMGGSLMKDGEFVRPGKEETVVGIIIFCGLAVLVSFSQISRYLYMSIGGFTADQSGYWHWLRFGIANVLESVLFDIPAIYNWKISEIEANAFWSQSLLFIYRTSLEFLVVAQTIRAMRFARRTRKNPANILHQGYWGFLFSNLGWLILLGIWSIPLSISIGAIVNDGLSFVSATAALKSTFPVMIALWLTWQSLRAFFSIKKFWNKLFALLGIVAGLWLTNQNWSIFKAFIGF